MKKSIIIIIAVVALVSVGGGGFYFGMNYGKSQAAASATAARAGFAGRPGRTGTAGGGSISGSIVAEDSTSITLQLPNNAGSKIIFYSSGTQISKTISGTSADLAAGSNVSVAGTANSDGSVTAQTIQIRPAGFGGQGLAPAPGK